MKSFFQGILFFINSIVACLLLLSYAIPFFNPFNHPYIGIFGLLVPFLILLNFVFFIYWLVQLKKQALLSIITLVIGFYNLDAFYQISERDVIVPSTTKVMSYNVRLFNKFDWIKNKDVKSNIISTIEGEDPDILCIQEYIPNKELESSFPYKYIVIKNKKGQLGQAIFSKYPIINKGNLDFKNSANNVIYADFIKNRDTVTIYNIHLESLKINPSKENFGEKDSKSLIARINASFKKQAEQASLLIDHEKKNPHKKIFSGDFNNTAFSWVYKQLKGSKVDAFEESGVGFGSTFNYPFPTRIDFILVDPEISIKSFKTLDLNYSDHFPIISRMEIN